MKSNYEGNVTIIMYDRNAKPREIQWDNHDGRGMVMYYPVLNEDNFHLLVNIPMSLMKLLCGEHPDRYRLFDYERAIPATRCTPSGANETVWITSWKYKKISQRKDPSDPESGLVFSYEFTEYQFGVPDGAKILVSKPVQAPPLKPTPPPIPQPKPVREQPDVVDVGVSQLPPKQSMIPPPEEITDYAKKPGQPASPERPEGEKKTFPHIRTEKEILKGLEDKCKVVGVDYKAANTEYRKLIKRPVGNLGVTHIGGFEKFVEEKLIESS